MIASQRLLAVALMMACSQILGCQQGGADFVEIERYGVDGGISTFKINRASVVSVVGKIESTVGREGDDNYKEYTNPLTEKDIEIMLSIHPSVANPCQVKGVLHFGFGTGEIVVFESEVFTTALTEADKEGLRAGLEATISQYGRF